MKRVLIAAGLLALMTTHGNAADAVLKAGSKAAYEASLLEMSSQLEPNMDRVLVLNLMVLALGPSEGTDWPEHFSKGMAYLKANPEEFYARLVPYEGLTAREISDKAEEIRNQ